MNPYGSLASAYDDLTADVPYSTFADFYEKVFESYDISPKVILDLACGTGSVTAILANRGYEMISVDASAEMLSVAYEKTQKCDIRPLLLCQRLEELDLYGTVDSAISTLDGFSYISADILPEVFRRLHLFIEPGGVIIFDILKPEALRALDGQICIDENESTFCVWRMDFDVTTQSCFYGIDIFERNGDNWSRNFEEHIEYAHETKMICNLLRNADFTDIRLLEFSDFLKVKNDKRRVFIAARRSL